MDIKGPYLLGQHGRRTQKPGLGVFTLDTGQALDHTGPPAPKSGLPPASRHERSLEKRKRGGI